MNILFTIATLAIISTLNVSAQDFSALERTRASVINAIPLPTAPKASLPAKAVLQGTVKTSYAQVDNCLSREANPEADKLGLPAQFCISRIGLEVPAENPNILDPRASVLLESKDGLKKIVITGYAKKGKDRTVIGSLFSATGTGSRAFAAIYLTSSLNGTVLGEIPQICGFIVDSASRSQEIIYRPAIK